MPHYYLTRYEQRGLGGEWHPGGTDGQPFSAIGFAGDSGITPEPCLLALPARPGTETGMVYLGDSLGLSLPPLLKSRIENRLNVPLTSTTLRWIIPELFHMTGRVWRPLRKHRISHRYQFVLGGQLIYDVASIGGASQEWALMALEARDWVWRKRLPFRAFAEQYRLSDEDALALFAEAFAVAGGTTISDAFTRADSTDLGANWTEVANNVEIVSNRVQNITINAWCTVRHNTALATDAHYSQIVVNIAAIGTQQTGLGPMTRFAAAANTGYMFELMDSTTNRYRFSKHVTGTKTVIATASNVAKPTGNVDYTIYGESSSADVHVYKEDAVQKISQSDTSIQDNLPAGFFGLSSNAGRARWDTFEAADLAAAALDPSRMMMGVGV